MFLHTKHVEPRPGYRLYVEFNNGICGEVALDSELWGEIFEPLKDEALFATAHHDPVMETVVWANGADIAPERLFDLLTSQAIKHVTRVVARDDFHLELMFDTGERKVFDANPYLDKGVFQRLRDLSLFKQAYVGGGTVCWPQDLDIAPETLYDRSVGI